LQEKYGDALLCVRYRYDDARRVKMKTVELIVDERPLDIPRFLDDDIIPVSVSYEEVELREQLRKMQARWDSRIKMWFVPYGLIRGTELESRIMAR
jgi:hypothetical protein